MGKRKKEQAAERGGGEFHVSKTKRGPGDESEAPGDVGSDATGDADGKAAPAEGRTDDWGQTTGGSTGSTNREAAAPGATRPEPPRRGNSVEEEEEDLVDKEEEDLVNKEEEDAPGQHGSAGDTEMQTHRGTGDVGDGPERLREAAGAAAALPGNTGIVVPVEVPGARREEEGEHGELGDADRNQEPPGARVVSAEGSECGAASELAEGGESRENGAEPPRATGTSDAESRGGPERLGVCAPAVDTEGGTTGAESTGKTAGEATAGREETRGGETPSLGAGLAPDPAVAAGGSPAGKRDGEGAAVSAAGTDTRPRVCCEETAEAVSAVTVTPAPTSTAEPPGVGTGTAEPTDTTEPPGVGTGTAEPTDTTEPPGAGTGTAEPTDTTEPPGVGTGTAEPTDTTEPPGVGTGTAEPTDTTEPPGVGTSTTEPTGTADPTSAGTGTAEPPGVGTGTAEPPGVGTGTTEPTGTAEPPGAGTGTAEPPGVGTGAALGAETASESPVAGEPLPPWSELPPQQPPLATDRRDPAEPAPPGWSHNQEPPHREDATDVVCGLILELSNLNRLAMSTHRGLETLRRPKLRQSRRPVPPRAGRRWKET